MEKLTWRAIIKEGKKQDYIRVHDEIWAEMVELLKSAGICNYTIWEDDNELFGYYECALGAEYAKKVQQESPIVEKWNKMMDDIMIMKTNSITGLQVDLQKVFELE